MASRSFWDRLRNRRIMHRFSHRVRFSGLGSSFQRSSSHSQPCRRRTVTPLVSIISSIKTFDELFIHTICSCKQIYVCIEVFDYCKTQKAQFHLTSSDNHEKKNFCILQQEAAELPHVLSQLPRCNRHIH